MLFAGIWSWIIWIRLYKDLYYCNPIAHLNHRLTYLWDHCLVHKKTNQIIPLHSLRLCPLIWFAQEAVILKIKAMTLDIIWYIDSYGLWPFPFSIFYLIACQMWYLFLCPLNICERIHSYLLILNPDDMFIWDVCCSS